MIGYQLSRIIIDIPWLHNTIGVLFLLLLSAIILLVPYILYRITRTTGEKRKEWSFEGKDWEYWKTQR
jgi:ABC-type transport system involved in cytochrome bd biosynthesis fused ATPase/permease subunit